MGAKRLTPEELKKLELGKNITFLGGYKPRGDKPPPVQPVRRSTCSPLPPCHTHQPPTLLHSSGCL
jgi:hypothetical protein